jgi:ATP-dependent DNA helicase RecG
LYGDSGLTVDFGPLSKILELEQKKGYADSAVIGGLDKFIKMHQAKFNDAISDLKTNKNFLALYPPEPAYALKTKQQRRDWTNSVLALLSQIDKPKPDRVASKILVKPENQDIVNKRSTENDIVPQKVTAKTAKPTSLDASATLVKGISEVLLKRFAKVGVQTIRDLLYFFPHRHLDYSQRTFINNLAIGAENTIIANIWQAREVPLRTRRCTEATVGDETGNIRIVWFNQPYLAKALRTGEKIIVSGKVSVFNGMPVFESPEWEPYEDKERIHTGRLVPVYPLTQGLSQRQVRRIMKPAVDQWSWQLEEFLPQELRSRLKLLALPEAINQAHYPEDNAKKDLSRYRLAFDELFLLQLGVINKKRQWKESQPGVPLQVNRESLSAILNSLPYKLTSAQNKTLGEILADLQQTKPMSRLLQGDVGSGKTVVATVALMQTVENDYQAAFMAPTEILAEQHFATVRRVLSQIGREEGEGNLYRYSGFLPKSITLAMLIGDLSQSKKLKIQEQIAAGEIDIVIGTQALIQKKVVFQKLGLIVIDEQHRFGVEQRSTLRQKGTNPHVLVMTATPIPRTLALTLYGDLDLSVIDQLPPGRQVIKTKWLKPEQRPSAFHFIRQQIKNLHQAFIICPLVEESESVQAKAAVDEYEYLSKDIFPDLRLGLLHGRMSSAEKEKVMLRFHKGDLDILVSTPVIEVGIDVPNATVMLVESADRFGLSQLHQFRGRVGRGPDQSYCMLLAENPSDIGKERLDLIEKTYNGFALAEEDLKLRGPGEFFGTRQSGLPDLKMAKLSDVHLLELARAEAIKLFNIDPSFQEPEHASLARELERVWKHTSATEWS